MIYGIDLGTTNSSIALKGEVIGPMVPSIVDLKTKKAGTSLIDNFGTERSFKVDMSMGIEGNMPINASSYVLKELMNQVERLTGNKVVDAVISVPAFFSDNQRQATRCAAELAGLNVKALINEPTAASMFFNKDKRKLTVVYDLGGGTFDVTVIDSRMGVYDIDATDGIIIGGDNLDTALRNLLIKRGGIKLHALTKELKNQLSHLARELKHNIQRNGTATLNLEPLASVAKVSKLTITEEEYIEVMKVVFKETIVQTKKVINSSILDGEDYSLLLVGGSTKDPYLQEWIREEITNNIESVDYEPELIVSLGASVYADLLEQGLISVTVSDVTKALAIEMVDGTAKNIIPSNSKIPTKGRIFVSASQTTDRLQINLYQGSSVYVKNNELIGSIDWDLGEVVEAGAEVFKIDVEVSKSGVIDLYAKRLRGERVKLEINRDVLNKAE